VAESIFWWLSQPNQAVQCLHSGNPATQLCWDRACTGAKPNCSRVYNIKVDMPACLRGAGPFPLLLSSWYMYRSSSLACWNVLAGYRTFVFIVNLTKSYYKITSLENTVLKGLSFKLLHGSSSTSFDLSFCIRSSRQCSAFVLLLTIGDFCLLLVNYKKVN
jgi:hypothetical protein